MLFALMGTIGTGYLLNGSSEYVTVNDYNYVTDVSGLYSYTPVTAYAEYSPATNNYQYSSDLATLGTYTSGINYTPAAAANLNPIITPSSGYVDQTVTLTWADLPGVERSGTFYLGKASGGSGNATAPIKGKLIPLDAILALAGHNDSLIIEIPAPVSYSLESSSASATFVAQQCGVYVPKPTPGAGGINTAIGGNATVTEILSSNNTARLYTTASESFDYVTPAVTYNMTTPVGTLSTITVNPNGTATYSYTYMGATNTVTMQISDVTLCVWDWDGSGYTWTYTNPTLMYSTRTYVGIEYLDPNQGVSVQTSPLYWSNGNGIGSAIWAFQKPAAASNISITGMDLQNNPMTAFNVAYDTQWHVTYSTGTDTTHTIDLGSGWQAVYVRMFYTGEIQTGPIDGFFNFTNYTLGPATTHATDYSGNEPIRYCKIVSSSSMRFACIGTTVESGTVPGAMFDATFNAGNYFPQYSYVRIAFDSAAYVGTSVQVGTWAMTVDSSSFLGTFTGADGMTYYADLTQPWGLTWNPGSNEISINFTPRNEAGSISAVILNDDVSRSVELSGLWAIDTDLYSVGTHVEEVYNWNFGNWGLDKTTFIVCAMGLTALLAIAFRLARVPFHALDYVVIFMGNVILWVVL